MSSILADRSAAVKLVDKYRPGTLAEVRGQAEVVDSLRLWLKAARSGAFIFAGGTGTGKTSTALALAADVGVCTEEEEFGGLYQIASGEQTGESVRRVMGAMHCRPFKGSGWRVLIVNEADAMTPNAAYVWLDALEHLPPQCVVIFTTNSLSKLPARFRDRCEQFRFESSALLLRPELQRFAEEVWARETGRSDCPEIEEFGPVADEQGGASFRRLLQQMEPHVRAARAGVVHKPHRTAPVVPKEAPSMAMAVPRPAAHNTADYHAYGRRWVAGESIRRLGNEVGMAWNRLQAHLKTLGYKRPRKETVA